MKKIVAIFLIITCVLGFSTSGFADNTNKLEKLINDFEGKGISKIEKKLGKDYLQYNNCIKYEYVKYDKINYYEVSFFYDDKNEVTDIDFIVDYSSNREAIDDLVFTFSSKFGTPDEYKPYTPSGEELTKYTFKDSNGEIVSFVKIYEARAEIDYYYKGFQELSELNFYELANEQDVESIKRSVNNETVIRDNGSGEKELYFGKKAIWLFDDLDAYIEDAAFTFYEDKTLHRFKGYVVPHQYGSDVPNYQMLNKMELYNFTTMIDDLIATLTEMYGDPAVEQKDNRFSGGKDLQMGWKTELSNGLNKSYLIIVNSNDDYKAEIRCNIFEG